MNVTLWPDTTPINPFGSYHIKAMADLGVRISSTNHTNILHVTFDILVQAWAAVKRKRFILSWSCDAEVLLTYKRSPSLLAALAPSVDVYHFCTKASATRWSPLLGGKPYVVLTPIVSPLVWRPPVRDNVLRVVSLGPLTWAGGFEMALDAVANAVAAGSQIHYSLSDQGTYAEAVIFAARQRNLVETGIVHFLSKPVLEGADLLLYPALANEYPFPLTQATGLLVLATDVGGSPEFVPHQYLVPARDVAAMTARLIQCATQLPTPLAAQSAEGLTHRWHEFYQEQCNQ